MVGPANSPIPNGNYGVATGINSSSPFITIFKTSDPTSNDINYPVKQRWVNTSNANEWILTGFTTTSGVTTASWLLLGTGSILFSINVIYQSTAGSYTYTPTSGMQYCVVEVVGAGGGGGGAMIATIDQACGGGGGSGAYGRGVFSSATIGASQPYVVGSGGTAGTSAGGNGGNGNSSSFGTTLITCGGGFGGTGQAAGSTGGTSLGGAGGGVGGTGLSFGNSGWPGLSGLWANNGGGPGNLLIQSGAGANSIYGNGGIAVALNGGGGLNGNAGSKGGGGGGGIASGAAGAAAGGAGGDGLVIITEYIFS